MKRSGGEKVLSIVLELAVVGMMVGPKDGCFLACWERKLRGEICGC